MSLRKSVTKQFVKIVLLPLSLGLVLSIVFSFTHLLMDTHAPVLVAVIVFSFTHSRPQRPRSFWSTPRIATSGKVHFSKHEQRIRFVFSANQICQTSLLDHSLSGFRFCSISCSRFPRILLMSYHFC